MPDWEELAADEDALLLLELRELDDRELEVIEARSALEGRTFEV